MDLDEAVVAHGSETTLPRPDSETGARPPCFCPAIDRALARQAEAEPSNLSAKNNLAVLALLLNAVEHRPHVLAREVFESSPNNPFHASTYAYSLVMQKKSEEALEVLRRLPEEQLRRPEISGYYGLALRAAGSPFVRGRLPVSPLQRGSAAEGGRGSLTRRVKFDSRIPSFTPCP